MLINLNSKIDGCSYFFWYEALFLASMDLYCWPNSTEIKDNIIKTSKVMEAIRSHLGTPLKVTSWYRPPHYNRLIKGAKKSLHMKGLACDFVPLNMDVNYAKRLLLPKLEELNIRMEDNGKGLWIHIDSASPGRSGRFFKP